MVWEAAGHHLSLPHQHKEEVLGQLHLHHLLASEVTVKGRLLGLVVKIVKDMAPVDLLSWL